MKIIKFKKSILIAFTLCATMAVGGYNVYKTLTMTDQERLIQANLEALTSLEVEGGDGVYIVDNHKNKWGGLFAGCKAKDDHTCTVKSTVYPDIL